MGSDSQAVVAMPLLVKGVTADLRDRILGLGPTRTDAIRMIEESAMDYRGMFSVID
jgi:hypothetical protein